jgi:probable F420-dependent oxidoreductase
VPLEHTRKARAILGADKHLCVEQAAILETNARKARAIGRQMAALYMGLPNYVNNRKRLGFTDSDMAGGGSDRLVDAVYAWGDERTIRRRLNEHRQAGADHVCVQAISSSGLLPDERLLELLAPKFWVRE